MGLGSEKALWRKQHLTGKSKNEHDVDVGTGRRRPAFAVFAERKGDHGTEH